MTTSAQIIAQIRNELERPQSSARRANNPAPSAADVAQALERFTTPVELENTRVESYLISAQLIKRFYTPAQRIAKSRKTHGDFARKYYVITMRGIVFARDVHKRQTALVVVNECRALVPQYNQVTLRVGVNKPLYHSAAHPFEIFPTQDGARWFAEWIGG